MFLAPSLFSKEIHRKRGFDAPIVHLPYFVPEDQNPVPTGTNAQSEHTTEPFFLFVGRLEKLKGAQTLIPVFKKQSRAQLLIAGTGSYEPELRRMAAGSSCIKFLGHVSGNELRSLYRQAVAVIFPSLCFEVLPLVPLEAFSERTPVIVRNLGGMPEIVDQSGGGFVYDTEDELPGLLGQLLDDPKHRREMGQNGYEAYQSNWTAKVHLERYLALIDELAAKKGM